MNLNERIKLARKEKVITNFKSKYPQAYDYFNSSEFLDKFVSCAEGSIILPITERVGSSMCTVKKETLPFYDENGYIDIYHIIFYLQAEGMTVEEYKHGFNQELIIALGE